MCFHCHYEEWWWCSRCSRCELVKKKRRLTLTEAWAEELISLWTHAGESAWFVHTLELTQVTGVAALINVCRQRKMCDERENVKQKPTDKKNRNKHLTIVHQMRAHYYILIYYYLFLLSSVGEWECNRAFVYQISMRWDHKIFLLVKEFFLHVY